MRSGSVCQFLVKRSSRLSQYRRFASKLPQFVLGEIEPQLAVVLVVLGDRLGDVLLLGFEDLPHRLGFGLAAVAQFLLGIASVFLARGFAGAEAVPARRAGRMPEVA